MSPVTPSRRVAPPPCEPSVASPAQPQASPVQCGPERSPASSAAPSLVGPARIKLSQFAREFQNFFFSFLFHQATCPQGERERATSNDRRFGPARRNVHILDRQCRRTRPSTSRPSPLGRIQGLSQQE
jgi:hypothetical protein